MSRNATRHPCRIVDSDSEEERGPQSRQSKPFTTRPVTAKVITRPLQPKIVDWDTVPNVHKTDDAQYSNNNHNRSNENVFRRRSSSSSGSSSTLNKPPHDSIMPTTTSESPPPASSAVVNTSNFDPIPLIQADPKAFVSTYIPKDYPLFVQCRVRRDKDGVQGGFYPTFYLQAERPSDKKKFFLLAARKIAKVNRSSEYMITTDVETLSEKSGGEGYAGKLRGNNLSGTEYTLYDNGFNPKKSPHKHANIKQNPRCELAGIVYNTNILGFKGPRQISAMLPELGREIQPSKEESGILSRWRERRLSHLIQLRNKSPKYNEETKTYVLQFIGNRVAQPSVKNFQMVIENDNREEEVVMQFGRVDDDTFTCDYRYPLSAIQAFGIALSSFDSRLVRE